MSSLDLHIYTIISFQPNLHLSSITSIAVAETGQDELYVTGGIDGMLVLSRFINSGLHLFYDLYLLI